MDGFIIGFQPQEVSSVGDVDGKLDQELTQSPGTVFGRWQGSSQVYVAMSDPPPVADLYALAARADARVTGLARLVIDAGGADARSLPGIEYILRPDPGSDISLPGPAPVVSAEKLVCPLCGGLDKHFSPPH